MKKQQMIAYKTYFKILSQYNPKGTAYYERPCIILEKQKRYDEAINICQRVIKAIKNNEFNASIEEFEHRLNRLIKKSGQ